MKQIDIYAIGHCNSMGDCKNGYYEVITTYKSHAKQVVSEIIDNTTANRVIIKGVLDAIRSLKEPCHIRIHTKTPLGFKTWKSSINKDLLEQILTTCKEQGYEFEYDVINQKDYTRVKRAYNL